MACYTCLSSGMDKVWLDLKAVMCIGVIGADRAQERHQDLLFGGLLPACTGFKGLVLCRTEGGGRGG